MSDKIAAKSAKVIKIKISQVSKVFGVSLLNLYNNCNGWVEVGLTP